MALSVREIGGSLRFFSLPTSRSPPFRTAGGSYASPEGLPPASFGCSASCSSLPLRSSPASVLLSHGLPLPRLSSPPVPRRLAPPLRFGEADMGSAFLSPQSLWGSRPLDDLGEVALEAGTGEGLPRDADNLPSSEGFSRPRSGFGLSAISFSPLLLVQPLGRDFCPPSSTSCPAPNDACFFIQLHPLGAITRCRTPFLSVGMLPFNETWFDGWTFGPWGQTIRCSWPLSALCLYVAWAVSPPGLGEQPLERLRVVAPRQSSGALDCPSGALPLCRVRAKLGRGGLLRLVHCPNFPGQGGQHSFPSPLRQGSGDPGLGGGSLGALMPQFVGGSSTWWQAV